jgi:hypothetical protein
MCEMEPGPPESRLEPFFSVDIDAFIRRCPPRYRRPLREKLEAFEALHQIFSALKQYEAPQ